MAGEWILLWMLSAVLDHWLLYKLLPSSCLLLTPSCRPSTDDENPVPECVCRRDDAIEPSNSKAQEHHKINMSFIQVYVNNDLPETNIELQNNKL